MRLGRSGTIHGALNAYMHVWVCSMQAHWLSCLWGGLSFEIFGPEMKLQTENLCLPQPEAWVAAWRDSIGAPPTLKVEISDVFPGSLCGSFRGEPGHGGGVLKAKRLGANSCYGRKHSLAQRSCWSY